MDKKGVMVEEWKARRKEWEKKRWKKGKKWFWEKSFLFLFDCVLRLPFFHLHPPNHHTNTYAHTHPPPAIQHDALVHTITRKQGRVLCCLLGVESETKMHHPHSTLHLMTPHNTHQPTQHRYNSWCTQQRDANCQ